MPEPPPVAASGSESATPVFAGFSEVFVILSWATAVKVNDRLCWTPEALVTCNVNGYDPGADTVPVSAPVAGLRISPGGKVGIE